MAVGNPIHKGSKRRVSSLIARAMKTKGTLGRSPGISGKARKAICYVNGGAGAPAATMGVLGVAYNATVASKKVYVDSDAAGTYLGPLNP